MLSVRFSDSRLSRLGRLPFRLGSATVTINQELKFAYCIESLKNELELCSWFRLFHQNTLGRADPDFGLHTCRELQEV